MIHNIIFDIGEVLVDFTYREHFAALGYEEETCKELINATILNPAWGRYDLGLDTDEEVLSRFIACAPHLEKEIRRSMENCHDLVKMRDFTLPWLSELKKRGMKTFYLSNYYEKLIRESPDAIRFTKEMDGGIFSCRVHKVKPQPEIYQALLSQYHLEPDECVFFDDREENVNAANALGIHGIVFHSYEQAKADLEALILSCT